MKYSQAEKYAYHMARLKREANPFPGRSATDRQYITRCVQEISAILMLYLNELADMGEQPKWLPEAVITPHSEADAIDSREAFENAEHDEDGYIDQGMHIRATNRIRIASWYRNADNNLYMTALIAVSPLHCPEWGALPLTLSQWRVLIHATILSHMQWKWIHAVRKHWSDDSYEVGGTFGWILEPCKKLDKGHHEIWTGQVTYAHVVRKYSEHVKS